MDFRQYWDQTGDVNIAAMAEALDRSITHLVHIRYGTRTPSAQLARGIVDWARAHTPEHVPDLEQLLTGVPKRPKHTS